MKLERKTVCPSFSFCHTKKTDGGIGNTLGKFCHTEKTESTFGKGSHKFCHTEKLERRFKQKRKCH